MVYKVIDVVEELGVSRQTIYKRIKVIEKKKGCIVDLNGTIGITELGLQALKEIHCKEIDEEPECKATLKVNDVQRELIDTLNKQIEMYEEQLKDRDRQITNLIQVTENSQVLQKMILSNTEVKLLAYREELEIRRNKAQEKEIDKNKGLLEKLIRKIFK